MIQDLFIWVILFLVSYFAIYYFADYLIDILVGFIETYTISPLLVGSLLLGLDLEETTVSVIAAIDGLPYLSLGNLIGNTIIAVVIAFGLPAFFFQVKFKQMPLFYYSVLLTGALSITISIIFPKLLILFAFLNIIVFGVYLVKSIKIQKEFKHSINESLVQKSKFVDEDKEESRYILLKIMLVIGIIFIAGEILVLSAEQVILFTGLSETFFGLVIMAFVTNVEEFWLIVNSIKKGQTELGISAQIGKIIWNIILIFGICGLIIEQFEFSLVMMISTLLFLIMTGFLVFNLLKSNISKQTGIVYSCILLVFLVVNFYYIT
ncbi:MAG: sodium:calcium antiporter [Candidatus Hodarchaeota archaeon]